jgi:hypothetical protein
MSQDLQSVIESQQLEAYSARRSKGGMIPLPNGRYVPRKAEYRGMKYPGLDETLMLGDSKAMLKKPLPPGAKIVWKDRDARRQSGKATAGLIRQGVLRPIGMDEIDTSHPYAVRIQRLMLAGKPVVAWESLLMCEMSAEDVRSRITVWDEYALSLLDSEAERFAGEIHKVSHGAMVGKIEREGAGVPMHIEEGVS